MNCGIVIAWIFFDDRVLTRNCLLFPRACLGPEPDWMGSTLQGQRGSPVPVVGRFYLVRCHRNFILKTKLDVNPYKIEMDVYLISELNVNKTKQKSIKHSIGKTIRQLYKHDKTTRQCSNICGCVMCTVCITKMFVILWNMNHIMILVNIQLISDIYWSISNILGYIFQAFCSIPPPHTHNIQCGINIGQCQLFFTTLQHNSSSDQSWIFIREFISDFLPHYQGH